jgi:hypothetical protein
LLLRACAASLAARSPDRQAENLIAGPLRKAARRSLYQRISRLNIRMAGNFMYVSEFTVELADGLKKAKSKAPGLKPGRSKVEL